MNNIDELLRNEIESELADLDGMDVGTEEYKTTVDGIVKLTDRLIDLQKIDQEQREKVEARRREKEQFEAEQKLKLTQMAEDKKDRLIKNCMTAAGIVIPSVLTIWGTLKSLEFEKTGTVTTIMGRGFINKLLPRK